MSSRKISILAALLVLIAVAGYVVSSRSQRAPIQTCPLFSVADEDISKIIIQEPVKLAVLEKRQGIWWLATPIEDLAEPSVVDPLVSTLKGLTIGSVISEKKDKQVGFQVDDLHATHLQVYLKDEKSPTLDIFMGKEAVGYGSTYVRFPGKDEVRIAQNLPSWMLIRAPGDFRKKALMPANPESIDKLTVSTGKTTVSLIRSSHTWIVSGSSATVAQPTIAGFGEKVDAIRAVDFIDKPEASLQTGLAKPYLTVEAETPQGLTQVMIGGKVAVKKGQPDPQQRYAQVKDRSVLMLVSSVTVEDLIKQLKTLPK